MPRTTCLPTAGLTLPADEVHVWRMGLDLPPSRLFHLARTLSPGELDRASRFRSLRDRNRFIARRGILRQICSAYLAVEAEQISFDYGPRGKPCLSKPRGCNVLRFSTSHSDAVALCAVTLGREVGVDIERVRPDMAWQSIAAVCLSEREVASLGVLPPAAQARAFLTLWTRKEAYVKARGTGLSVSLGHLDVLGGETCPAVLAKTDGKWRRSWPGSLQDLDVGRRDVAAMAVEEHGLTVVSRQWR